VKKTIGGYIKGRKEYNVWAIAKRASTNKC